MKEKVLLLLNEMLNDSKRISEEAESELCGILTEVINKIHEIDKMLGEYVRHYPDRITRIDSTRTCDELPEEIDCNNADFYFKTKWLGMSAQEYFEETKEKKINALKRTIANKEASLEEYRNRLETVTNLKFEDLDV